MAIKVAKVAAAGVKKTIVKKKEVVEETEEKTCKWCEQGECWSHGQIEKPKSAKGKGFKGKGKGKGGGGGGGGDVMGQLLALLGGGGGGKGNGGGCKWCAMGQCWSHGGGKGGGSRGGKGGGGGKFKVDKSGGELGEFTGTIKSFGMRNAYGFIECDELQDSYGDVFLHGDMIKGYRQGHTVKFTAVLNKDGKAVAIDLKSGLK